MDAQAPATAFDLRKASLDEKSYFLAQYYKKNLFDFVKHAMGFGLFTPSHLRWAAFIQEHIRPAQFLEHNQQTLLMVQAPREVFKSTFFSIGVPTWCLVNNPNLTVFLTSATTGNTVQWLSVIKKRAEQKFFIELFGRWFNRDEWRTNDIVIKSRDKLRTEPSIHCAGMDTTVTSKHFDLVLADDLVTPEDRDSQAKRQATVKYIDDLIDLLNKKCGVAIFVGTPWHFEDAYNYLEKIMNPKLKAEGMRPVQILKEPAVVEEKGKKIFLFPELLGEEKLKEIRLKKSDISNFSANYLLSPIHPSTQVFHKDSFQWFSYGQEITKDKIKRLFIHIDPSQEDKKGNDYCAIVAIAHRKEDGKRLVADAVIQRLRPSAREEAVLKLYQYFLGLGIPQSWQIETVGGQKEIKRSLVAYMLKQGIADFEVRGKERVDNKTAKIRELELPIFNGSLLFREDYETAPGDYRLLITQLQEHPLGHDDGPDALKEAFDYSEGKGKMHFGLEPQED